MSAWSIDHLLQVISLARAPGGSADVVMLLENGGTPVVGESPRRYPDGKSRLDITGWTWGQAAANFTGAAEGARNYTPLTVVRKADAASASLTSLSHTRSNRITACISVFRSGGDSSGVDTLPMFELKIEEAQIVSQYFLTTADDSMLNEILVFSYRSINIRSAPQQGTGQRGAVRECQINMADAH